MVTQIIKALHFLIKACGYFRKDLKVSFFRGQKLILLNKLDSDHKKLSQTIYMILKMMMDCLED